MSLERLRAAAGQVTDPPGADGGNHPGRGMSAASFCAPSRRTVGPVVEGERDTQGGNHPGIAQHIDGPTRRGPTAERADGRQTRFSDALMGVHLGVSEKGDGKLLQ